ncbi:spore coat protein A [Actinacidiphila paucisporea]|uniref:Spore coat protein A n=1 Tax=Actinacidiphila paucisporea TaxID=310782 RepID=A0A1M6TQZ5_9ACTN|nr:spore coat protein A [Actinacidiphila paucisporea]
MTAPGAVAPKSPNGYVRHCHSLEHEDDDLMRPWTIVEAGD